MVATAPSNLPGKTTHRGPMEEIRPTTSLSNQVREHGNPATPGRPDDLEVCDLTAMEEKLLGAIYATDDWVGPKWGENVPPSNTSGLNKRQRSVDKLWGEKAPKSIRPRIQPCLKNSMCTDSDGQGEEDALRKALGALSEEEKSKHSAEACRILTELKEPNVAGHQKEPHPRNEGASVVSWGGRWPPPMNIRVLVCS